MPGRRGPGVSFCLGLVLAILCGRVLGGPRTVPFALAIPLASLLSALRYAPRGGAPGAPGRRVSNPVLVGAVAGLLALPQPPTLGVARERVRSFRGVAVEDSIARAGGGMIHRVSLRAVDDGQARAGAVAAARVLDAGTAPLWAGDEVVVRASVEPLAWWDRDDYLARAPAGRVEIEALPGGLLGMRRSARLALEDRIRQMGYPMSGFFLAMFLGDRSGVEPELVGLYRTSGCLHVLALSGSHLVLVYGIALLAARRLPWHGARRLLPLMVVIAYVGLAGPLPSLLRALTMLAVAWVARGLNREVAGMDLLALALAVVLLAEPRMLFDLSLELSVAAVLGMILVGGALSERAARFVPRAVALPLFAGLGAQTLVAPILLAATGAFQPIGLVSGLAIAPLSTAVLLGGLADLALPLAWFPAVHGWLGAILDWMYRFLVGSLEFFGAFPAWRSWLAVGAIWGAVGLALAARPIVRAARR